MSSIHPSLLFFWFWLIIQKLEKLKNSGANLTANIFSKKRKAFLFMDYNCWRKAATLTNAAVEAVHPNLLELVLTEYSIPISHATVESFFQQSHSRKMKLEEQNIFDVSIVILVKIWPTYTRTETLGKKMTFWLRCNFIFLNAKIEFDVQGSY